MFDDVLRFVNVRFTVEEGATLVFDMPITRFGPNSGVSKGECYVFSFPIENAS